MREGWCATCGQYIQRTYSAGRKPRRMYCNDACRRVTVPGQKVVEVDEGLCIAVPDSCRKRGNTWIGVGHGYGAYAMGCRCTICTEGNRLARMRGRLGWYCDVAGGVMTAEGGHGINGYKHGCRCDACRAAKRVENARRYQAT